MPRFDGTRLQGRWSEKFDCCVKCNRTTVKHMAKGLCGSCYKGEPRRKQTGRTADYIPNIPAEESKRLMDRAAKYGHLGLLSDATLERLMAVRSATRQVLADMRAEVVA